MGGMWVVVAAEANGSGGLPRRSAGRVHCLLFENVLKFGLGESSGSVALSPMLWSWCCRDLGRAMVMQRRGLEEPSESDDWVVASKADVARLSIQWDGLKFLLGDCVPQLMEVTSNPCL